MWLEIIEFFWSKKQVKRERERKNSPDFVNHGVKFIARRIVRALKSHFVEKRESCVQFASRVFPESHRNTFRARQTDRKSSLKYEFRIESPEAGEICMRSSFPNDKR